MATGVLPICLGRATKLSDIISGYTKKYRVRFDFGIETDTFDTTGNIINISDYIPSKAKIIQAIKEFIGEQLQIPPKYSAKKLNGKKFYEYARKGIEIDIKPNKITIYDINNITVTNKTVEADVICSKGTYIRSLVHDIGLKLNTYATMTDLVRLKVGNILIEDTIVIGDVSTEDIIESIKKMDIFLDSYEKIFANINGAKLLENGNPIPLDYLNKDVLDSKIYQVYNHKKELIGLFHKKNNKLYPKIMLTE